LSFHKTYPQLGFRQRLVKWMFRLLKWIVYRKNDPIHRFRKGMDFFTGFLGKPKGVVTTEFTIEGIEAEWIIPEGCENSEIIMYFLHGGAYGMGSIKSHRPIVSRIAKRCQVKTLHINYRLAPEHVFPAAVEDSVICYQWLLSQGINPGNIVIAGDSAGGGLTMATLLKLRDDNIALPAAGIGLSPWLDLGTTGASYDDRAKLDPYIDKEAVMDWAQRYLGDTHYTHPLASPVYSDPAGLPPILIQVGTHELLHDDAIMFAEKAAAAGVDVELEIWEDMFHVWHAFAGFMPEADMALDNIAKFVHAVPKPQRPESLVATATAA
jgi:monoterpene epsilon-lactone hydrolase